jgi:hypothetical protein
VENGGIAEHKMRGGFQNSDFEVRPALSQHSETTILTRERGTPALPTGKGCERKSALRIETN